MYKVSEKPLVGAAEIKARVAELASEIALSFDYDILLSALTGAYMFTADLSRELAKVQGARAQQKKIAFIIPPVMSCIVTNTSIECINKYELIPE